MRPLLLSRQGRGSTAPLAGAATRPSAATVVVPRGQALRLGGWNDEVQPWL